MGISANLLLSDGKHNDFEPYYQVSRNKFPLCILGSDEISEWLDRDVDKISLQELVDHKTKEVIGPLIPNEIRAILTEFLDLLKRPIFEQEFRRRVKKAADQELAEVARIHKEAKDGYNRIIKTIADGMFFRI